MYSYIMYLFYFVKHFPSSYDFFIIIIFSVLFFIALLIHFVLGNIGIFSLAFSKLCIYVTRSVQELYKLYN